MMRTSDFETGPSTQFFKYLQLGEFRLQRSTSTGEYTFYPRVLIPGSGVTDLEWVRASGRGTVYSCTRVRKPERGGDYVVAIVELAEGPRMMTNIEGAEAADVHIGMAVSATIDDQQSERPRVVFKPA